MNVEVENLPNCMTTLRVEVPPDRVSKTWEEIAGDYGRHARIPGYRPGKAPRGIVEKKFQKQIREEVKKKLLSESCREAISSKKLKVLSVSDVEDFEIGEDKSMRFTATLITAPEFELPDYKNIPLKPMPADVSDEQVSGFIENLRDRFASFNDIPDGELKTDLFAVIDFDGKIDGKPAAETLPKRGRHLSEGENFWLRMSPDAFLPGFCEKLLGAKVGDTRSFQIDLPADFPIKELAGMKIDYEVAVRGVKEKVLPELNEEFVARFLPSGGGVDAFRADVRKRIESEKLSEIEDDKRAQIMSALLEKVECELPPDMVRGETRRTLADLVRENQSRGVPDETLRESQEELLAAATRSARDKLKGGFILNRIAEQEKIAVGKEEFDRHMALLARRSGMTTEKLWRELENHNGLGRVEEEILNAKVLDFLTSGATVQPDSQPGKSPTDL